MKTPSRFLLSGLIGLTAALSPTLSAQVVVLESKDGRSINGEVLGMKKGKVLVKREDGKTLAIALNLFSPATQKFVKKKLQKQQGEAKGKVAAINKALGQPLFSSGGSLWDEDSRSLANRLEWPKETETRYTSSYRIYVRPTQKYLLAAASPRTGVVYGDEDGKVEAVSIIYSNKGDSLSNVGSGQDHFTETGEKIDPNTLEGSMLYDRKMVRETLSKIFGEPEEQRMQAQGSKTIKTDRWDWNGHSFLLALAKEEYVQLRIVPTEFADAKGRSERISDGAMRERLASCVTQGEKGDVYIDHIPMVDQGPKGYCAPATFERAMRHAGVDSDMYLLATLATDSRGTNTHKLYDEVAFTTRSKGGRTAREIKLSSLAPRKVAKYIDKGVPILWRMCSLNRYNKIADERTEQRANDDSWDTMGPQLAEMAEKNSERLQARGNYHICMIVGYNQLTGEICVSDSWGDGYDRRWIHHLEAEAVSNGAGYVIDL